MPLKPGFSFKSAVEATKRANDSKKTDLELDAETARILREKTLRLARDAESAEQIRDAAELAKLVRSLSDDKRSPEQMPDVEVVYQPYDAGRASDETSREVAVSVESAEAERAAH